MQLPSPQRGRYKVTLCYLIQQRADPHVSSPITRLSRPWRLSAYASRSLLQDSEDQWGSHQEHAPLAPTSTAESSQASAAIRAKAIETPDRESRHPTRIDPSVAAWPLGLALGK